MTDFIENTDSGDGYTEPIQTTEDEIVSRRIYCASPGCTKYIIGLVNANVGLENITIQFVELPTSPWTCTEHS